MKKVAIMQPYFFPYIGYFSLIKQADEFILLDTVQFIRHGWIERNRILKQDEGWLYIKVPLLKHDQQSSIKDALIDNGQSWQNTILSQIEVYKKTSPYYDRVKQLVAGVIGQEFKNITDLDKACLEAVCNYLGLETQIKIFSKMNLEIEPPAAPDEWALNICKAVGGVTEYWNPPGGQALFDRAKYTQAGIEIKFQEIKIEPYNQHRANFEPSLSIIDVLMFNSPEDVSTMLDRFEII